MGTATSKLATTMSCCTSHCMKDSTACKGKGACDCLCATCRPLGCTTGTVDSCSCVDGSSCECGDGCKCPKCKIVDAVCVKCGCACADGCGAQCNTCIAPCDCVDVLKSWKGPGKLV